MKRTTLILISITAITFAFCLTATANTISFYDCTGTNSWVSPGPSLGFTGECVESSAGVNLAQDHAFTANSQWVGTFTISYNGSISDLTVPIPAGPIITALIMGGEAAYSDATGSPVIPGPNSPLIDAASFTGTLAFGYISPAFLEDMGFGPDQSPWTTGTIQAYWWQNPAEYGGALFVDMITPEPSTAMLIAIGLALMSLCGYRRVNGSTQIP